MLFIKSYLYGIAIISLTSTITCSADENYACVVLSWYEILILGLALVI